MIAGVGILTRLLDGLFAAARAASVRPRRWPGAPLAAAVCAALVLAGPARAQWAQSLYTEDGIEIVVDARVFSLFAMLNSLGYDDENTRGPPPLFRAQYSPARAKTRQNLGRPGDAIKALRAIVEKNPLPKQAYVDAVLELGPAPAFEAPAAASALAKALAEPLSAWFSDEGGSAILKVAGDEARTTQKRLLPLLDAAAKAATKLVRVGDAQEQLLDDTVSHGRVAVVLNELDVHGEIQRVNHGDVSYVVATASRGDADDVAVTRATVLAYARMLLTHDVQKAALSGTLAAGFSQLGDAAKAGVGDEKGYALELLACAFAMQLQGADACTASPLSGDARATAALATIAPRVATFAADSALVRAALPALLAPGSAPPEPSADGSADGKAKPGKGDKGASDKSAKGKAG